MNFVDSLAGGTHKFQCKYGHDIGKKIEEYGIQYKDYADYLEYLTVKKYCKVRDYCRYTGE